MGNFGRRKNDNQAYPKGAKASTDPRMRRGPRFFARKSSPGAGYHPNSTQRLEKGETKKVEELRGNEYQLVTVDHERDQILKDFGYGPGDYGSLLVRTGDGHFKEIWGIHSTVPSYKDTAYVLFAEP